MPARRSGYGQPNIHTRLADEDKSLFVTPFHFIALNLRPGRGLTCNPTAVSALVWKSAAVQSAE
eukprot:365984-Chlamydomonas_euryale.AAC.7